MILPIHETADMRRSPSAPGAASRSALDALVVVPPHLRYVSGPLLGPALLRGAAVAAGMRVEVLDLAVRRRREYTALRGVDDGPSSVYRGDHDRPFESDDPWCLAEEGYIESLLGTPPRTANVHSRPAVAMPFTFEQVNAAAAALVRSPAGEWIRRQLGAYPAPVVVGISLLYPGQVVWAIGVASVVRSLWPETRVIWGGPHVTALSQWIARDVRYASAADGFVAGHAEATFVELIRAVSGGLPLPPTVWGGGSGRAMRARSDPRARPEFGDLSVYAGRLTLPVQTTIGCAYGLCGFCSYPAVEGDVLDLGMEVIDGVLALARRLGAVVAVKDSLVLPHRLAAIADRICGEAEWSACTKLNPRLDAHLLRRLHAAGCRTLELGVETLVERSQRLIRKPQPRDLVLSVLDAAASARLPIVANYITGFPGEDPDEAGEALAWLEGAIRARGPDLEAKLEHHVFELDRLAPLAGPDRPPGLRVLQEWPWSSVLDWELDESSRTCSRDARPTEVSHAR